MGNDKNNLQNENYFYLCAVYMNISMRTAIRHPLLYKVGLHRSSKIFAGFTNLSSLLVNTDAKITPWQLITMLMNHTNIIGTMLEIVLKNKNFTKKNNIL
jgi:hypothetical protein